MINLIPPEGQKSVRKEYTLRVLATMSFLFGFIVVLLSVAHIPTYVLVGAQINDLDAITAQDIERDEAIRIVEDEVKLTRSIIAQFKRNQGITNPTNIFYEINSRSSDEILFKAFILQSGNKNTRTVQVQGVATTREALAQFKTSLESSSLFSQAEIPISDLARDTELPFTITITLTE